MIDAYSRNGWPEYCVTTITATARSSSCRRRAHLRGSAAHHRRLAKIAENVNGITIHITDHPYVNSVRCSGHGSSAVIFIASVAAAGVVSVTVSTAVDCSRHWNGAMITVGEHVEATNVIVVRTMAGHGRSNMSINPCICAKLSRVRRLMTVARARPGAHTSASTIS